MSFLNGKIAKIAKFTIPINNQPDVQIKDLISGNSLSEVEGIAEQLRNDYEAKNIEIKDPNKPVRVILEDVDGQSYLERIKGTWKLLTQDVKDALEDENTEAGTPPASIASKKNGNGK